MDTNKSIDHWITTYDILKPWADEGILPAIQRLIEEGAQSSFNLDSAGNYDSADTKLQMFGISLPKRMDGKVFKILNDSNITQKMSSKKNYEKVKIRNRISNLKQSRGL